MKKRPKKIKQKVVKGTSSAILISILVHAGLGLLAATLVIFTVMPKPPVEFEPPPQVKVPKMPLKKLKVRTKKPSKPKSTAKLTAVVKQIDMNTISFPDLPTSGIGVGISDGGAGSGGWGDLADLDGAESILGKSQSMGNDLEGTYYDFKRRRSGTFKPIEESGYLAIVNDFLTSDWDLTRLDPYFKSEQKRYASSIVVPTTSTCSAPAAFGEDRGAGGFWMVYYKGDLVYPEDITFRFWGAADHFLGVRVDGEDVFFTAWQFQINDFNVKWKSNDSQRDTYTFGYNTRLDVGKWITLKAGEPRRLEIALGDNSPAYSGLSAFALLVEVKDVEYPQNDQGGPILPIFKTAEPSHDYLDVIYRDLYEDDCSMTNGPVFRDF